MGSNDGMTRPQVRAHVVDDGLSTPFACTVEAAVVFHRLARDPGPQGKRKRLEREVHVAEPGISAFGRNLDAPSGRSLNEWSECQRSSPAPSTPTALPFSTTLETTAIC